MRYSSAKYTFVRYVRLIFPGLSSDVLEGNGLCRLLSPDNAETLEPRFSPNFLPNFGEPDLEILGEILGLSN